MGEPVDGVAGAEQTAVLEQGVEGAVLAEDLAQADGADEGRQHQRHEDQSDEEGASGKTVTVGEVGQRQAESEGEDRGGGGEQERGQQAVSVDRVSHYRADERHGEVSVRIKKSALYDLHDRPEQEAPEESEGAEENEAGEPARHGRSIGGGRRRAKAILPG